MGLWFKATGTEFVRDTYRLTVDGREMTPCIEVVVGDFSVQQKN